MKKNIVRPLLALIILFLSAPVFADESTTITTAGVSEIVQFMTKAKSGKGPLLWKKEKTSSGDWYQSVIVTGGERITLAYFPNQDKPAESSLSVWWRKEGTKTSDTCSGSALKVDTAVVHFGAGPKKQEKLFRSDYNPTGLENAEYWQVETGKRLVAVLEYFHRKK